jgi:hypothetical protein
MKDNDSLSCWTDVWSVDCRRTCAAPTTPRAFLGLHMRMRCRVTYCPRGSFDQWGNEELRVSQESYAQRI